MLYQIISMHDIENLTIATESHIRIATLALSFHYCCHTTSDVLHRSLLQPCPTRLLQLQV
jgi:hypothetical protein